MLDARFRRCRGGVTSLGLHAMWCPKYLQRASRRPGGTTPEQDARGRQRCPQHRSGWTEPSGRASGLKGNWRLQPSEKSPGLTIAPRLSRAREAAPASTTKPLAADLHGRAARGFVSSRPSLSQGNRRYPERDLNPHGPSGPGGFKPPASTVPPSGLGNTQPNAVRPGRLPGPAAGLA